MQDRWDVPYSEVQGSECLRDMCRSLHAHLTTNWRSKESPELFDFYTGLYDTADDLAVSVQKAQFQFPVRLNAIDIDIVLCVSHANRMIINKRQNEAKAMEHEASGGATVHIDWSGDDIKGTTCQPQPMLVWVGIELIGCPRGCGKDRYGIVQGVVYTITAITESHVALTMNTEYHTQPELHEDAPEDAPDSDVADAPVNPTVPISDVPKVLRLAHAMC